MRIDMQLCVLFHSSMRIIIIQCRLQQLSGEWCVDRETVRLGPRWLWQLLSHHVNKYSTISRHITV